MINFVVHLEGGISSLRAYGSIHFPVISWAEQAPSSACFSRSCTRGGHRQHENCPNSARGADANGLVSCYLCCGGSGVVRVVARCGEGS